MLFFFLLCCFSVCLLGQIEDKVVIVDKYFTKWIKSDDSGCAIGIVKEGNLIYANGFGIADLEHDIEITPSSVFYIGSITKQFVTFSILLLEEQGKLNLNDRIQKFLPDFPEYDAPITIRHLIHHMSGIRAIHTLEYLRGKNYLDNFDKDEVYDLIKRQQELNFSP